MESQRTVETESLLSRREATLRSAATTCLAGIALMQAIGLPSLFAQGRQFAAASAAAMALCLALGIALAAAPAGAGRQLWQVVAAACVLVLAGWAVPRAVPVPGFGRDDWTAMPGAACAALAAVCLVLAVVALRPTRAAARGLAAAVAVVVALVPGIGALLVALGPGLAGGETSLAASVHVHSHGFLPENAIEFQPIAGGHGGHFVYKVAAPPHQTAVGIALIVAAALMFTYGAVGYLRRRSAPPAPVALPLSAERGLA